MPRLLLHHIHGGSSLTELAEALEGVEDAIAPRRVVSGDDQELVSALPDGGAEILRRVREALEARAAAERPAGRHPAP
jgi:hypothetical protein